MNGRATIANSLWVASSLSGWTKFRTALNHPEETQRRLLLEVLRANANCAYGRKHGFNSIQCYRDFARRVPLADYEDIQPWIERIQKGERQVLSKHPVTHLIPTSGSTGARKLIPFSCGLQKEFDRAIGPWITDLARQCPGMLCGPAYWSVTPKTRPNEDRHSQVRIGFADDANYLGGVKSWLVRAVMIVPEGINPITSLEDFQLRTLVSLLGDRELRLISVWHPSFLTLLLDALKRRWDEVLENIFRLNPRRTKELGKMDPQHPEIFWPELRVISCWGDGHAAFSFRELRERFPRVLVQGKGLLATEAFMTFPFAGLYPVAIRSHFFEFIDEAGKIRPVHELRDGEDYEMAVTTSGGLWRYRMGDQVRVNGFLGRTPSLQFVGKRGNISDLFGEKLSEAFVTEGIAEAFRGLVDPPRFALLAPDRSQNSHYTLYIEGKASHNLDQILDQILRRNPNYDYCRRLEQLGALRLYKIKERGYEFFASRLLADGRRLGEIKPAALSRRTDWSRFFPGNYIVNTVVLA